MSQPRIRRARERFSAAALNKRLYDRPPYVQQMRLTCIPTEYGGRSCARGLAAMLCEGWYLVWPSHEQATRPDRYLPGFLMAAQITSVPFLREVQQALRAGMRLHCARWSDGTVALYALPDTIVHVPPWLPLISRDTARHAESLAALTEIRDGD